MEKINEHQFCFICKHVVVIPYCYINSEDVVCSEECYKEHIHDCQR